LLQHTQLALQFQQLFRVLLAFELLRAVVVFFTVVFWHVSRPRLRAAAASPHQAPDITRRAPGTPLRASAPDVTAARTDPDPQTGSRCNWRARNRSGRAPDRPHPPARSRLLRAARATPPASGSARVNLPPRQ